MQQVRTILRTGEQVRIQLTKMHGRQRAYTAEACDFLNHLFDEFLTSSGKRANQASASNLSFVVNPLSKH